MFVMKMPTGTIVDIYKYRDGIYTFIRSKPTLREWYFTDEDVMPDLDLSNSIMVKLRGDHHVTFRVYKRNIEIIDEIHQPIV